MKSSIALACLLFLPLLVQGNTEAFAGWETGAKAGYISNLSRSVGNGQGDTYLGGYAAFARTPSGDSRIDWTLSAVAEGAVFARLNDLDYAAFTVSPGIIFFHGSTWTASAAPFLQAKSVADSDQSAWVFGGRINLRQQLKPNLYSGEYYVYTNSQANAAVFSYTDSAFGGFLGVNWTPVFFTEIGYEYGRGDSYQSLATSSAAPVGGGFFGPFGGSESMLSQAFGTTVVRERVTRNSIAVNAGIDWTPSLFSVGSYAFTSLDSDLGSSVSHSISAGIGYRF
ncbi:MAG: hypothetical protein ACYC37_07470 [Desulfobacteria bacterium]